MIYIENKKIFFLPKVIFSFYFFFRKKTYFFIGNMIFKIKTFEKQVLIKKIKKYILIIFVSVVKSKRISNLKNYIKINNNKMDILFL